jgi:hypothetical protein
MNYPAAELTGYQTALTALFFEAKLRGIHPKGLKKPKQKPVVTSVHPKTKTRYKDVGSRSGD